jgi:peptidoglycan/xylan/chitin deacetylase (PgdA/CDA1 family)
MSRPVVLCYHAVSSSWPASVAIPERVLESQLTFFYQRGYVGMTFAEAERGKLEGTLPRRCVVVTFDDGFASTLRASSTLAQLGFPATVFIVTHFTDTGEPLSWPGIEQWSDSEHAEELLPLNWSQLEELSGRGWEVASHTVSHRHLPDLSDADLLSELRLSRQAIEERVGSCETVAYPYGRADQRVASAAAEVGYLAACAFTPNYRIDERYRRCRIGLTAADRGLRLRAKVTPATLAWRRSRPGAALDRARLQHRERRFGAYFRDGSTGVVSSLEHGSRSGET